MSEIVLDHVSKVWGQTTAVDDVSLTAAAGELLVLLGPSGCGKSTSLRMIAGLEEVSAGRILIEGRDVTRLPPAKRRISMVFQSYALFPHLDVAENIVFGLKVRKLKWAERSARLARVAELVGLGELLHRRPAQLSGGQRQRVALARAIVAENPICLMDEPLSNLDAKLRHDMRVEIRALQQRLGMTVVYVTHDQTEAMSMADQVVLMCDGKIVQAGRPEDLYDRPATTFVASFIGTPPMNLIDLTDGPNGAVVAGAAGRAVLQGPGHGLRLGIRPEHLRLADGAGIEGEIVSADYLGADTILTARVGNQSVLLRVPGRSGLATGEPVRIAWSPESVHVFDGTSGRRMEDGRAVPVAA
ncbi:ABC transporter ATP-binding protein [Rhodospirillaceae bacterium SYSU D60014]|uniref:ABC transporter ATP-binding protein n=1 Tax=Virgifigura deserti TaxID=2268457 RepID=UPI000E66BF5A